MAELKRKISEASGSSESTVQTRSRQVEDADIEELRAKLASETHELNRLRCAQSAWETVDILIYSALSLVIGETKLHDSNIARRALRDHDSAQEAGGFSVQTGTGLMKEIEKQMSAHFVTLIREVEILLQPNNAYWRELFLAPRTLNGPGPNASRPKPPASRPGHGDSIYPLGEKVGCRRCHQLTHYARDCPETLAARERRAARN